ncbi:MAG: hypothetical protein Q9202_002231 [Teloschistes flavicans]
MEADVERPLREYQKGSREMQAMSTIQGNLAAVARELDTAQKRVEKVKGGKSSASKVADATAGVETLRREWASQAPYVFEQLQALDENRINHLRDLLTQLQTHEVDQVERNRLSAESCLNVLLNVDTAEEISTFVARSSSGAPTMQQAPIRNRQTSANLLSTPTPSRTQDDRASEISATSEGNPRSGSASGPQPPSTPERKPRGFGLRRLGTVMGRRKDSKNAGDRPPSPEKRSRPVLSGLRRGTSSKNMQTIPSPDEEAMPMPKSPRQRESSSPQPIRSQTMATSPLPPEPRRTSGRVNGDTIQPAPTRSSSLPVPNGVPANSSQVEEQPPVPPPPTSQVQTDTEGFNVAPPAVDEISRAQQEAAAR